MSSTSAQGKAIQLLAAKNLHQCLFIPQTQSHERLRVTFSTTGNFNDQKAPVILFVGPLFGTRYFSLRFDKTAREHSVRLICVDRPGFGGSTPVPVEQRMSVWLETVPLLLQKLNVKHVALMSHSAGTTYLLNTLYRHRDLLDPQAPYAALLGPWVHSEQSNATLMTLASKLPDSVVSSYGALNQFIVQKVMPTTSWSGGMISSFIGLFQAEPGASDSGETTFEDIYGVSKEIGRAIEKLQVKYVFAEGVDGINSETVLCLKKADSGLWDACEDYGQYVDTLMESEKRRGEAKPGSDQLRVDFYFAESDIMIGKGGQKYLEQLWRRDGMEGVIEVGCYEKEGTNHETVILDLKKGALPLIFGKVKQLHTPSEA